MKTERLEVGLPQDVSGVEQGERLVVDFAAAQHPGTDEGWLFALRLAVHEVLVNAVTHGFNPEAAGIGLRVEAAGTGLAVTVTDRGPGFCPEAPGQGCPEPTVECGRGLFLVKQLVDAVEFGEEGRSVCLRKKWPDRSGGRSRI